MSADPDAIEHTEDILGAMRQRLHQDAPRYEFFQAVRSLLLAGGGEAVGLDYNPRHEAVRFRSVSSLAFPAGQIAKFHTPPQPANSDSPGPPVMEVSFLGLTGPAGALPRHYTETVIARGRGKDYALRDFLDIFNHRIISLFYRVWEKHRLGPLLESADAEGQRDRFTLGLMSLVALGPRASRDRFEYQDQFVLYYSGLFAHYPRCATSLRRLIETLLTTPTEVLQFQGQWLRIEKRDQSQLPLGVGSGLNCELGVSTIAGERVWDVQSKFRVRLGPLSFNRFLDFLPGGKEIIRLGQVVRSYVGPELDFDIQPVLQQEEVPACQLASDERLVPRLGWTTWILSSPPLEDADDAVFVSDGMPTR